MRLFCNNDYYEFLYYESENSWVSQKRMDFLGAEISIEIRNAKIIDEREVMALWNAFTQFSQKQSLIAIQNKSHELIKRFFGTVGLFVPSEIFSLKFEMLVFNGTQYSHFFGQDVFTYSFIYKLYKEGEVEIYDTYADYYVTVESAMVVSCGRSQL